MLQLLLFHLLLLLASLFVSISLCGGGGKKKKQEDGQSMQGAGTPGANGDGMMTAIGGGSNEKDGTGASGRISIHGPVHDSKESAESAGVITGEGKEPSAESVNMAKAAPGKVEVSKEKTEKSVTAPAP